MGGEIALARASITQAHALWKHGDVVKSKLLAETAWEAASKVESDEAEAVKLLTAHFIMHAWTPAAIEVAVSAASPADRTRVLAFIRDEYAASAAWLESVAAKGLVAKRRRAGSFRRQRSGRQPTSVLVGSCRISKC